MIQHRLLRQGSLVLTDRFTARVLGAVVLLLGALVDISMFIFVKPEVRDKPEFPLLVLLPSLPILALGVFLFWRASKLKDES
jgi:hypothetical protein